jgi:hypothetical protein
MDRGYILAEIRRTAEENVGTAPGRALFEKESGIRAHEWGKYWPRWGDALEEAGFTRNEFNQAISDDALLGKLAEFVRQLNRFPVVGDLRVRASADPAFPNEKTFTSRFGGMRGLRERLKDLSFQRGWPEIVALCESPEPRRPPAAAQRPRDEDWGYVYLIRSGRYYKIGRSNSVGRRERELAVQLPDKVKLVHSIKSTDPVGIERYWHGRFEDRRKNGEWFELGPDDIAIFRRHKFMG